MDSALADRSVFISYRRASSWAVARYVYRELTRHSFDVFLDVERIGRGDWKTILQEQIAARAFFVAVLTSGTLDALDSDGSLRIQQENDMVRQEYEWALAAGRHIILLIVDDYSPDETPAARRESDRDRCLEDYLAKYREQYLGKYLDGLPVKAAFMEASSAQNSRCFVLSYDTLLDTTAPSPLDLLAETLRTTPIDHIPLTAASAPLIPADAFEALALSPGEMEAERCFHFGTLYHNAGRLKKAVARYTRALELKPDYYQAYDNRGVIMMMQGDYAAAERDFEAALRAHPCDAEAYNNRGQLRELQGRAREAIADYTEAIRLDSRFAPPLNNRGWALFTMKQPGAALPDLDRAIALEPGYAAAYNNRAVVREALGDTPGALEDCAAAVALNPDYGTAYYNWGRLLHHEQRFTEALHYLSRAIALGIDLADVYVLRGDAHRSRNDFSSAIADYTRAIQQDDTVAEAYWGRAETRSMQGFDGPAQEDYARALSLDPTLQSRPRSRGISGLGRSVRSIFSRDKKE